MTDREMEEKLRSLAPGMLTETQTDNLSECLWRLDQVEDIL